MLNMTPTPHFDSPIRRSGIGAVRTPIVTPTVNDDEAERRECREQASFLNVTEDTIADKEGLQYCLKFFNENKITKDNAWKMSLIDNFSALIAKHHKSLQNFQMVGTTLEASSKIYGLRVDSVHTSVIRMSSGLTTAQPTSQNKEDGDPNGTINDTEPTENECQPRTKKKRTRKPRSTIAKSKESINAKLDTIPFTDPFFAKQNSSLDINSSDRLMQNVLPSVDSQLRLRMDYPFWDNSEERVMYSDKYEHTNWVTLPIKFDLSSKYMVRPQLTGYKITNTPAEDDSKDESPPADRSFDQSQMDVAFDMEADVEPIAESGHFIDVDLECAGLNELTTDEQNALEACKGLRRQRIVVEDLRPLDSSCTQLEYSYRPLDNISQFWAGPSHWKFRSFRHNRSTNILPTSKIVSVRKGSKKVRTPEEIRDECPDGVFLLSTPKTEAKLRKANICKKWDPKELKLPPHMHLDRNRFLEYSLAPGLAIANTEPSSTPDIETSAYNYDNANDKEYCSNIEPENDDDTERSASVVENLDPAPIENTQNDTVIEIGTVFAGAPQMVERITVPFAKKAKVVDMKQLKKSCLSLIHQMTNCTPIEEILPSMDVDKSLEFRSKSHGASFKKIYEKLPPTLTKNLQEVLTPSVAFYAILHLANDNELSLKSTSKSDFAIWHAEN